MYPFLVEQFPPRVSFGSDEGFYLYAEGFLDLSLERVEVRIIAKEGDAAYAAERFLGQGGGLGEQEAIAALREVSVFAFGAFSLGLVFG